MLPQTHLERLELLYRISQTFNSSLNLEDVLNSVIDEVIAALHAERAFLMLVEPNGSLSFQTARGIDHQTIDQPEFQVSRGIVEHVARTAEPILTVDAQADAFLGGRASVSLLGLRSVLCVPLQLKEQTRGLIYVDNRMKEGSFNEADLDFLMSIACSAVIAIENARLYEVAQEANKLKNEFLAVTTHELKTPLNSILGFTDCLLTGIGVTGPALSEDQRGLLERVKAKSKDLLCSINDILDMSRLEAQKVETVLEPYSPAGVIDQFMKDVAPQVIEKDLMLKLAIAPDIPELVIGDVHLLSRILSNLILNAIKFTEQGHVEVDVRRADADKLQITITDTGVGIPPDKLETIFQPFHQVDSSTTRRYRGSGLGLAIARSNARLMSGDVTVRSEVGAGSVFTVTLPLIVPEQWVSETDAPLPKHE